MSEGPEKNISRRDAIKASIGAAVGGVAVGGLVGSDIQEAASDKEHAKQKAERTVSIDDSIEGRAIQQVLKEGGRARIDLKIDSDTGRLKGFAELFDKDNKPIFGGVVKIE